MKLLTYFIISVYFAHEVGLQGLESCYFKKVYEMTLLLTLDYFMWRLKNNFSACLKKFFETPHEMVHCIV